jgi:acyl dehydratase
VKLDWQTTLHGEQEITWHRNIPAAGTLHTTAMVETIFDKGDKGALINIVAKTKDDEGNPIYDMHVALLDRGAGNFGGDRGPKPEIHVPAEGVSPDFSVTTQTCPSQALLYRLSGDKNPLHADPEVAKKSGLPKPILHGLCTYGFTGRAVLNSVCDNDPSRIKKLGVRFLNPVFPGEALTTEGWKAADDKYVIQVKGEDGRLVLGNAYAMIA